MEMAFDAMTIFERLKDAGFSESQARARIECAREALRDHKAALRLEFASKEDFLDSRLELKEAIHQLGNRVSRMGNKTSETCDKLSVDISKLGGFESLS